MTREINKRFISEVANEVKIPKYTLILCHRNPDPDTLGSAFGLKHLLEYYGSRVKVACCDKSHPHFDFITGGADLTYVEDSYERIIAVDVASPMQLGELEFLADKVNLTIDHHSMNTRFSDYNEDFCAACAEIIMEIAYSVLNIFDKLPKHFYECIYAGISGDTGCFKYSNTTYRTMKFGAELIARGIDFAEINHKIFDTKSRAELKGQELTYKNMTLCCDGKLAVTVITNQMKEENGICDLDISDIVSYIRCIEGVLVAVSLKETKDENVYSISSRSNCEIDVAEVCASFGGGGHKRAAGAKIKAASKEEAVKICIDAFSKVL